MSEPCLLKYVPYHTVVNPSFWHKLTQLKLDVDKLNEDRKHIWGMFTNIKQPHNLPILEIDCTSFNSELHLQKNFLPAHGYILNRNTIEQFKDCNKLQLIDDEGSKLIEHFQNRRIFEDPSLLNTFFILSFADLKKYRYYFWFAFPTTFNLNVHLNGNPKFISDVFSNDQINSLMSAYNGLSNINNKSFFIVKQGSDNNLNVFTLSSILSQCDTNVLNYDELYFGFSDPCISETNPGWPMRNFVAFILYCCPCLQGKSIKVLSFRVYNSTCVRSITFNIKYPEISMDIHQFLFEKSELGQSCWTGWQKNDQGKFKPRIVDMSSSLDPIKLAETSVDLNLKLMKWRLLPDINLDKLKYTKCLLFGAGTLGCGVARNLLAWGVQHITLIDNGKVSYSNPVRQSLFTHEDCLNGGKPKAKAAADNLRKIYPVVHATGYDLTIPMPGHPVGDCLLEETKTIVELIQKLVSEHDVLFLLMDSRESRWLPTVLGAHFGKIVINAALGFETYLVMRHGVHLSSDIAVEEPGTGYGTIMGNELGCYFCNDITAPGNSLKDRTLDQQCTVTRPGISPIASALAVELAVSILQHNHGALAPAIYQKHSNSTDDNMDNENDSLLGLVPHSIRGFLSTFTHVLPATRRFQNCIACSRSVLDEYKTSGFEFLLRVFNSSKYLEELTGLTELHDESAVAEIWELCSSGDSDEKS